MVDPAESAGGWCERLYLEKAALLVLYGRALGLSYGEAEDVVQETFVALLALAEAPGQPAAYCLRAFRNRALNYRRGVWRRLRREWESRDWFAGEAEADPRERAAMRCLEQLPAEQREVIVLKLWHGCTFAEIGDLVDASPNTVAGRYRYGLARLRRHLEERDDEDVARSGRTVAGVAAAPHLVEG